MEASPARCSEQRAGPEPPCAPQPEYPLAIAALSPVTSSAQLRQRRLCSAASGPIGENGPGIRSHARPSNQTHPPTSRPILSIRSLALALSAPVGTWEPSIVVLALMDTAP